MTMTKLEVLQETYKDAKAALSSIAVLLEAEMKATCQSPEQHAYVQHRDRQPPWCNTCRRFRDGSKVDDPSTGW